MPRKLNGFSLIEMAIVLMIIGLVGGMTLPALKVMLDWQKTTVTADRQEKILYALANYAIQNNCLPYAADPVDSQGREDTQNRRRRGIVPFHELGLAESVVKDGYHRWFTYVVNDHYVIDTPRGQTLPHPLPVGSEFGQMIPLPCMDSPPNKLTVKLPRQSLGDNIALVLISHGAQGRGAYPNPMDNPPQSPDEINNTQSENLIVDRAFSQDPQNPFSHKVIWVTGRYLMAFYGHATCPSQNPLRVTERLNREKAMALDNASRNLHKVPDQTPAPKIETDSDGRPTEIVL